MGLCRLRFYPEWIITNPDSIIKHLDQVSGLKWVSNEGIEEMQPFFYQAMREIGFYGYDIEPFKTWTMYQQNPTFEFTLPEGIAVEFRSPTNAASGLLSSGMKLIT